MLQLHLVQSSTCPIIWAWLLQWGSMKLRMDFLVRQLLEPLLALWAGVMKVSVVPLGGQLLWTVGVTAAMLNAMHDGERKREIKCAWFPGALILTEQKWQQPKALYPLLMEIWVQFVSNFKQPSFYVPFFIHPLEFDSKLNAAKLQQASKHQIVWLLLSLFLNWIKWTTGLQKSISKTARWSSCKLRENMETYSLSLSLTHT